MHKDFADKIVSIIQKDPSVIGLAVGGSWLVPDASVKARNVSIIEQNAVDALEMIRKN